METKDKLIGVIGLGYVGLPLAVEFGKVRSVLGFDISRHRIGELQAGNDSTLEVDKEEIQSASGLRFTTNIQDLEQCGIFIVTVPTPIDQAKRPDLSPLIAASKAVGSVMKPGSIVIYESTVYPGCTEEICVPLLEQASGLKFNEGFYCGYSPERINPGDKTHRLPTIKKVTSGSTPAVAAEVDELYKQIITAGTHLAAGIRVAEAAKVIENTQRDLNIALMNELSLIFGRLGIDTLEVLEAAGTKWNFLPFRPGLVGGHCIGVDPYYLTHKAQEVGYHPEVILAGRRINDSMAAYVADETVRLMLQKRKPVVDGRVLILGLTFKENCPDVRNTKIVDIAKRMQSYGIDVDIYDPWADAAEAAEEYGLQCLDKLPADGRYSAIIVAVGHSQFLEMGPQGIKALGESGAVIFDVKGILPVDDVDARL